MRFLKKLKKKIGILAIAALLSASISMPVSAIQPDIKSDSDFWTRIASNAILPISTSEELGTSSSRIAKIYATALDVTTFVISGLTISGDIDSTAAAIDWDLYDNDSSALSFDAAGKAGILNIDTTDTAEGISTSGYFTATGIITGGTLTDGTMSITGGDLTSVGSIGTTGARITKLWATDIESTNAIAADITGNAATVSTITGLAPDTATTAAAQPNITSLGTLTGLTMGGTLDMQANDITMTGTLGLTGARLTKGWFTDLEVTNAIAGSITGNAATVSTITGLAPDTATTAAAQPNITSLGTLTSLAVSGTYTGNDDLTLDDTGTDVNSPSVVLKGDSSSTELEGSIFLAQGANPYLRFSVDDDNTTPALTAVMDLSDNALTFATDNVTDIGAVGANRPKDIYAAGNVTATSFIGSLTGQADTVATITGLAPDTATTAAAQPNITSVGTLTSLTMGGDITTTNAIGRDTDNEIAWTTDDQLDITIGGVTSQIASISTGTGNNDKLVTQGYVDDNAGGSLDDAYDNGSTITADAGAVDIDANAVALDIDHTTNGTVDVVDIRSDDLSTGDLMLLSNVGNSFSTGNILEIDSRSLAITSGQLLKSDYTKSSGSLNSKTGAFHSMAASRTYTNASATISDDYDLLNLTRTSVVNGASPTFNATGALLYLENVATQTSGTLNDSVNVLELVQDADSTGLPIDITQNAVVSTNYKKYIALDSNTIWNGTGNSPDGVLTGAVGDLLINGSSGEPFYNTDGATAWSSLAGGGSLDDAYNAGSTIAADSGAVDIDSNGGALDIDGTETTQTLVHVQSDTLTTGKLAYFYSNSSDGSVRELVRIENDDTAADGVNMLVIRNDGDGKAIDISSNRNDTGDTIHASTGTSLTSGNMLHLETASSSFTGNIVKLASTDSSGAGDMLYIDDDGTGANQSIVIDSEATTASSGVIDVDAAITTGVVASLETGGALTSGQGLFVSDFGSNARTTGIQIYTRHVASGITANRTGQGYYDFSQRTLTAAATRNDEYDNIHLVRNSIVNNAGATFNVAGSMIFLEINDTETAGSLNQSSNYLEFVTDSSEVLTVDASGNVDTAGVYEVDGVQGITDNTSYWLCTASDCATTCQADIDGGIITGCT